jgi:SPP1 family predicted phage head-tail adaptor
VILNGKLINPGEFNTKIELVSVVQSQDAGGFYQQAETVNKTVWAQWTNIFGMEVVRAAAAGVEISATVRIRYLAGVNNSWRVRKGSEIFEIITDVDDIRERHEYMEFKVRRMAGA